MIEEQEVMERTNSPAFCWSSTNKGSFGTIFYTAFSSETSCRPSGEPAAGHLWSMDHMLTNIGLNYKIGTFENLDSPSVPSVTWKEDIKPICWTPWMS
jgi:hypothetical protein